MIVLLPALNRALGIAADDSSQDEALMELEARFSAWVEGETHRRFNSPTSSVEIKRGSGTRTLFTVGHMDGPAAADPDFVYITVEERGIGSSEWELVDTDLYERRNDAVIRTDGSVWSRLNDYRLTYLDGYNTAPPDIQQLIIDMIVALRSLDDDAAGITSEKIGDYSYTLDASFAARSDGIDDVGRATLNRWKRQLV